MTLANNSRQRRKRCVPSAQAWRSASDSPGRGKSGSALERSGRGPRRPASAWCLARLTVEHGGPAKEPITSPLLQSSLSSFTKLADVRSWLGSVMGS